MPPKKDDSRALIHKLRTQIRQSPNFNKDRAKYIGKKKLSDLPKAQLVKIAQDVGIDTKGFETTTIAVKPATIPQKEKKAKGEKKTKDEEKEEKSKKSVANGKGEESS
mmetsp:Transcript_24018/g.39463  ORF Transcript_24018/g.39463 Transcript_24018/m.39463 type:complete len:108 (-) Transcript_24018:80-403(-)|eukprot:CAMPEP_0184645190 /NCGR_PEP_ID=MMETSP0308-20130426/1709_1 /TAXON_ID=38269 /ORGANISM="Gloeochaete witrockiana, Strain SAG 46.84" /LENGTH=107 /DNA_ID=CAMNT_0027074041 /DNA_START=200 /DNA_END=523 /DNA_ORIENTATION=+